MWNRFGDLKIRMFLLWNTSRKAHIIRHLSLERSRTLLVQSKNEYMQSALNKTIPVGEKVASSNQRQGIHSPLSPISSTIPKPRPPPPNPHHHNATHPPPPRHPRSRHPPRRHPRQIRLLHRRLRLPLPRSLRRLPHPPLTPPHHRLGCCECGGES